MNVIELRNYLLKQGKRDEFIQYFKKHFVQSQNEIGAYTPGLFSIKDEENRFFWIRGFDNMRERSRFLPAFYGGEVWKKFGPAANDMMLEWHDVYLIKPASANADTFSKGFLAIDYYTAKDNQLTRLIDFFNREYIPFLNERNIKTTLWVSEMEENDFPRLPVYQNKNQLIVLTGFNSEKEYEISFAALTSLKPELTAGIEQLIENRNRLLLYRVEE